MSTTPIHSFNEKLPVKRNQPFLWEKRGGLYQNYAWNEVAARVNTLARWLGSNRIADTPGCGVAIIAPNRPDVLMTDLAVLSSGLSGCYWPYLWPMEKQLQAMQDQKTHILFAGTRDVLELWTKHADSLPWIQHVVAMEGVITVNLPASEKLKHWKEVMELGRAQPDRTLGKMGAMKPEHEALRLFLADGSTQSISHHQIMDSCQAAMAGMKTENADTLLTVMPLAEPSSHVLVQYLPVIMGGQTYYEEVCNGMDAPNVGRAAPNIIVADSLFLEVLKKQMLEQLDHNSKVDGYALSQLIELGQAKLSQPKGLNLVQKAKEMALKPMLIDRLRGIVGGKLNHVLLTSRDAAPNPDTMGLMQGMGVSVRQMTA